MNVTHFIQFVQPVFVPLLADAAGIIFGMLTIATVVIVFIRAFEGGFNR
jgi:hypothetical protein